MARNGIDEFKEVMADFRSVTSLAAKGALAAPFADLILRQFDTGVSPPWPPGVLVITSVAELLVLMAVFNFFFPSGARTLDRLMIAALVVLCAAFVGYLLLFSNFTHPHPKTQRLLVLGYEPLNEDVRQAFAEGYTNEQALEENEFMPAKVWTERSITHVRIGILLAWLLVFISLSAFIGLFVMAQRRKVVVQAAAR